MRRDLLLECAYIRTLTDNDELVEITEGYMDHAYDLFHKHDPSLTKDSFYSSLFKLAETAHNFNDDNGEEDDSDYNDTENQAIKDHDKTSRVSQEQKEALRNQARKKDYGERFRREASYRAKEFKARMFNEEEKIYLDLYNKGILTEEDLFFLDEGFLKKALIGGALAAGTAAAASYGYGKNIMNQANKDYNSGSTTSSGRSTAADATVNNGKVQITGNTLGRINYGEKANNAFNTYNLNQASDASIANVINNQGSNASHYTTSKDGKHYVNDYTRNNNGELVNNKREMGVKDYMKVGLKGVTSRFNKNINYTPLNNNNNNNNSQEVQSNTSSQGNNNPKYPQNAPNGYTFIATGSDGYDYYMDPKTKQKMKVGPSPSQ